MRVLGVDTGSRITGYGVIETDGADCVFVGCGVIRVNPSDALSLRLRAIHESLVEVIQNLKPDEAAFESVFYSANAQSALKLGHARGVCIQAACSIGSAGVRVFSGRSEVRRDGLWAGRETSGTANGTRVIEACGLVGALRCLGCTRGGDLPRSHTSIQESCGRSKMNIAISFLLLAVLPPQQTFTRFVYCREFPSGVFEKQCLDLKPDGTGQSRFKRRGSEEASLSTDSFLQWAGKNFFP